MNELRQDERASALEKRIAELEFELAASRQAHHLSATTLDRVLRVIQDHVAIYDHSWRYLYVNDAAAQLLGHTADALTGKVIWNVFPDAVGNTYYNDLHRARDTGQVVRSEHYYAPFDKWFLNHIYPSSDSITVFSTDITDRKKAEQVAERSRARYQALIDATSLGIWSWNPQSHEGDYSEVQRWWAQLTGQPESEQSVDGWLKCIHPEDQAAITESWTRSLSQGERFEVEYRLLTKEHGTVYILSIAVPIRNESGAVVEWIGSMQDVTEMRQATQDAISDRRKLEAIVEASPLAIVALDKQGDVLLWNRAAQQIFGWSSEEAIGRRMPAVPEGRLEEFYENVRAVTSGQPLPITETRRITKDGRTIDAAVWAAPLRDKDGQAYAMVAMLEDISEEKDQQRRLALSQQSLKLAMRGGKMGYWSRDLRSGEVYWSPELEELFGLPIGSFAGSEKDFFHFVHPDDVPAVADAVRECLETGKEYSVEFRFVTEDGRSGWMDGRGGATFDEHGTPIRLDGIGVDITDRKQAEAAILESERHFRLLAQTMPVIAWSLDSEGKSDFINRRYHEYTGVKAPNDPAKAWVNVVHPEDQPIAMLKYREAVESGSIWEQELRLRRHDGEYRWHLSRLEPVRDEYGSILRWFGTSTDIHDRKAAEAELERRVAERTHELREANRELEGFTYTVSHDLRAPLRAISATSMILLQEASERLSGEEVQLLKRQAHNARRLGILIDELLKLSRIGRQELVRGSFNLSELANDVADELIARMGVPVEISIAPDLEANGDPKLVRFVLLNLIENAMKFSPKGGLIEVGQQNGAFYVRDQGIGFDMAYVEKLFQPFERLVSDHDYPGTGIGLANAQRIVHKHGGKIWAESSPGKGATFYFTL